ncbi:MAG: hypothetical protein Q4B52_05365 [Tissierellia bacterium]|nr:hypothetical protein [Tissierellia bacterium]
MDNNKKDRKTNKSNEKDLKQLLKEIKTIEVDKENGLVFFGTCHCSATKD